MQWIDLLVDSVHRPSRLVTTLDYGRCGEPEHCAAVDPYGSNKWTGSFDRMTLELTSCG
jgi:hypothetical protein